MLTRNLWKRVSAPLLAVLLVGCWNTAADPVEPGADEARPAPGAAEPKGDPEAELRKVLAEIEKARAEFETVEKKLARLRRQASDLRRTIAARRGPGKTHSIEQLLQGAPYGLNPKTTLEKERFRTWLAENVQGKRVSYKFTLKKSSHWWSAIKTKEGRYEVRFQIVGHHQLGRDKNFWGWNGFRSLLHVHGASLEMVDRLENLEGKEATVELDIAAIALNSGAMWFTPRNVRIDGFEIPEAMRKD